MPKLATPLLHSRLGCVPGLLLPVLLPLPPRAAHPHSLHTMRRRAVANTGYIASWFTAKNESCSGMRYALQHFTRPSGGPEFTQARIRQYSKLQQMFVYQNWASSVRVSSSVQPVMYSRYYTAREMFLSAEDSSRELKELLENKEATKEIKDHFDAELNRMLKLGGTT